MKVIKLPMLAMSDVDDAKEPRNVIEKTTMQTPMEILNNEQNTSIGRVMDFLSIIVIGENPTTLKKNMNFRMSSSVQNFFMLLTGTDFIILTHAW